MCPPLGGKEGAQLSRKDKIEQARLKGTSLQMKKNSSQSRWMLSTMFCRLQGEKSENSTTESQNWPQRSDNFGSKSTEQQHESRELLASFQLNSHTSRFRSRFHELKPYYMWAEAYRLFCKNWKDKFTRSVWSHRSSFLILLKN